MPFSKSERITLGLLLIRKGSRVKRGSLIEKIWEAVAETSGYGAISPAGLAMIRSIPGGLA